MSHFKTIQPTDLVIYGTCLKRIIIKWWPISWVQMLTSCKH